MRTIVKVLGGLFGIFIILMIIGSMATPNTSNTNVQTPTIKEGNFHVGNSSFDVNGGFKVYMGPNFGTEVSRVGLQTSTKIITVSQYNNTEKFKSEQSIDESGNVANRYFTKNGNMYSVTVMDLGWDGPTGIASDENKYINEIKESIH